MECCSSDTNPTADCLLPTAYCRLLLIIVFFLGACSSQKQISRSAQLVIKDSSLLTAHVGISIYDATNNKFLYNYQGDKYFIPASNIKIPTCYVAMKYLGEMITGARMFEDDTSLTIIPTGDPTLLHPDFILQPLLEHLKTTTKSIFISQHNWRDEPWGSGWAWNDFSESYMAEKSAFPIYGNVIRWIQEKEEPTKPAVIYSIPEITWEVNFTTEQNAKNFLARRNMSANIFTLTEGQEKKREHSIPFITNGVRSGAEILSTELKKSVKIRDPFIRNTESLTSIYSQPLDSVLKPMMHRSDNFFAEQMLLMVSNERLRYMNAARIIDTILKTDLKDLPQRPRWVDGSGLSRYNLFSPQDFVTILGKMRNEFGMERLKVIFPTGNEGTLTTYYKNDSNYVFAKTGTLSGVVAISGYLYTKRNSVLFFSVLVNNHQTSPALVRRKIEHFLQGLRESY